MKYRTLWCIAIRNIRADRVRVGQLSEEYKP